MILNQQQLLEAIKGKEHKPISIVPFDESSLQPASYDLQVGKEGVTTSSKKKIDIEKHGLIELRTGDIGVLLTLETVTLDLQHVARIGLRSKFGRMGLIAAVGPQIDPGYSGKLMIGLINLTPNTIVLDYKEAFITLEFHKLDKPAAKGYDGPYQNKETLSEDDIRSIAEGDGMPFSEVNQTLITLVTSVGQLNGTITELKSEWTETGNKLDERFRSAVDSMQQKLRDSHELLRIELNSTTSRMSDRYQDTTTQMANQYNSTVQRFEDKLQIAANNFNQRVADFTRTLTLGLTIFTIIITLVVAFATVLVTTQ